VKKVVFVPVESVRAGDFMVFWGERAKILKIRSTATGNFALEIEYRDEWDSKSVSRRTIYRRPLQSVRLDQELVS
jgi:hypothetical protein